MSSSIEPWTGWRRSPDPFLWPALESQRRSASPIEETVDRDNTSGDYVAIGGQNWLRSQSFPVAFALSTIPLVILFLWVCWPALLA
ncbi:MAG: hypothetical protein ABI411_21540 [Tahibacter sp.]